MYTFEWMMGLAQIFPRLICETRTTICPIYYMIHGLYDLLNRKENRMEFCYWIFSYTLRLTKYKYHKFFRLFQAAKSFILN